jgi:lipopolysaccharide transport system permease protein
MPNRPAEFKDNYSPHPTAIFTTIKFPALMVSTSSFFRLLIARRELVGELIRRELRDRHEGQILGVLWAYGHPLLLMMLYTVLFSYVFPARYGAGDGVQDYSVNVFAGIVSWLAFQAAIVRAPSIFVGYASLVKQIVFPIEVLPVVATVATFMSFVAGFAFAVAYAAWHGSLTWFALALPVLVACQISAMVGTAFILSAGGVLVRDLKEIVGLFCTINLFALPILYNPTTVPAWLEMIFLLNPFSYMVWCWQDLLYHGHIEHVSAWIVFPAGSIIMFMFGWKVFGRARYFFGDSL